MARMKRATLEVWAGDKTQPELKNCLESPTNQEIEEELRLLPGGDQISTLEINVSKTHWIALGGSVDEGFHARYHEFSRAGEWESVREDLPLDVASRLLCSYRDQNPEWKNLIEWQRRAITPVLEKEREEQENREIISWFGKALDFAAGFSGVFSSPFTRSKRRPGAGKGGIR
jgi:hypothetical protein